MTQARPSLSSASDAASDPWQRFTHRADAVLGLAHFVERPDELRQAVARAAAAEGFADAEAYLRWFLAAPAAPDRERSLATHFTVGETYFFREPEQLQVLADRLLEPLLHARRAEGRKVLRLWCAACSTGEEAYTLAIVLHRLLPDLPEWDVQLLATDLNPRALDHAREAVYGRWSFRALDDGLRDRFFEPAGPERHRVRAQVRRLVRFAPLNLLGAQYPRTANGTAGCDVIFCRNVLLYFDAPARRRVIQRLAEALAPGGWLQVASAEQDPEGWGCLAPRRVDGVTFFQRPSQAEPATRLPASPAPLSSATPPPFAPAPPAPPVFVAPPPALPAFAPAPPAPPVFVAAPPAPVPAVVAAAERSEALGDAPVPREQVRAAADQGSPEEALTALDAALGTAPLDPSLHFVRATVLQSRRQPIEALAALRQALFLDPDFVMARFALGNLHRRLGDAAAAARQYAIADQALATMPPDAPVPEGDDLTAGQLRQLLASLL